MTPSHWVSIFTLDLWLIFLSIHIADDMVTDDADATMNSDPTQPPGIPDPYYPIALPIDQAFKAKYVFHHRRGKTFQERLYVFLEHPGGWLCFVYHFTVWVIFIFFDCCYLLPLEEGRFLNAKSIYLSRQLRKGIQPSTYIVWKPTGICKSQLSYILWNRFNQERMEYPFCACRRQNVPTYDT